MRSDVELLEAWRGGDDRAGNELFHRHFDAVCRFFRNKVRDGVEDLIQKTFLACVESRDQFRGDASFRTYLFVVARNELYTHLSRARRGPVSFDPAEQSVEDMGLSPTGILARKSEHKLLLQALRQLPLDHQILLELYYWEGLAGPALAAVLDIPEGTVRSRIRKARADLVATMRQLASSPDDIETTLANLDDWARDLRDQLPSGVRREHGGKRPGKGRTKSRTGSK